jgi:hypothetical protein
MSSITLSERVRPKTSGTTEPGLEELPSDRPDSGTVRAGILDNRRPKKGEFFLGGGGKFGVVLARCHNNGWVTFNATST